MLLAALLPDFWCRDAASEGLATATRLIARDMHEIGHSDFDRPSIIVESWRERASEWDTNDEDGVKG